MATQARTIRRLEEQLAEARVQRRRTARMRWRWRKAYKDRLFTERVALHSARDEIKTLNIELDHERLARVSAQRGLVNYMREMGLGDRIGYDPDADPDIRRAIAEGKLPPKTDLKRITAAVLADKAAAESGQIQAGGLPDPTAPLTANPTLRQTVG